MNEEIKKHLNEAFRLCAGDLTPMQDVLKGAMEKDTESGKAVFITIATAVVEVISDNAERRELFNGILNFYDTLIK